MQKSQNTRHTPDSRRKPVLSHWHLLLPHIYLSIYQPHSCSIWPPFNPSFILTTVLWGWEVLNWSLSTDGELRPERLRGRPSSGANPLSSLERYWLTPAESLAQNDLPKITQGVCRWNKALDLGLLSCRLETCHWTIILFLHKFEVPNQSKQFNSLLQN